MRTFLLSLILAAFIAGPALLTGDALAQPRVAPVPEAAPEAPGDPADPNAAVDPKAGDTTPVDPKAKLDELFKLLAAAKDGEEAETVERSILRAWLESGSPTIDLLMRRAIEAMREEDYALALDHLDSVVSLKPDYAEGWNKRATVYYLIDEYGQSIADIEHALKLEPRHFGAMSGLGRILEEIGEEEKALTVFHRVLEIHPNLEAIQEIVEELERKVGGRDI